MKDLVQKRLESYRPKTSLEEMNALKEITQEVALYSLYKAGFFQEASFLGGTSLRIIHGLDRFSEDLDFSTKILSPEFDLDKYLEKSMDFMNAYGYDLTINTKDLSDKAVKSRFLKDDSIKKVLTFKHKHDIRSKVKVKVEIDTRPPKGAIHEIEYVGFPTDFAISQYDLSSLMSGKLHAILCRPYPKGRDWFDLLWYISRNVIPNILFLKNALFQLGPWKGVVDTEENFSIGEELRKKIESIDWSKAVNDVRPFLSSERSESLELWGTDFFLKKVAKLSGQDFEI
ncbi:MAG: nucleotidyl transferase AbiEii/AbiGii toxin family protein [Bacteriovoracaceae bacterium]|nr:nucleotidyl transferase AbiEii/AbiGii toxin family protein [Bacteriovoracaceae bacterium]